MCQKCAATEAQAPTRVRVQPGSSAADALKDTIVAQAIANAHAQHKANEATVIFQGHDKVAIKPFASLDDAVVTGEKVAGLIYPDSLGDEQKIRKYEADLLRAAAMLPAVPLEQKFKALAEVLGVVLMGFDSENLDDVKDIIRISMEKAAQAEITKNTTEFLQERGFAPV